MGFFRICSVTLTYLDRASEAAEEQDEDFYPRHGATRHSVKAQKAPPTPPSSRALAARTPFPFPTLRSALQCCLQQSGGNTALATPPTRNIVSRVGNTEPHVKSAETIQMSIAVRVRPDSATMA